MRHEQPADAESISALRRHGQLVVSLVAEAEGEVGHVVLAREHRCGRRGPWPGSPGSR